MASRAAKFISAIFASVIAGAPMATMSQSAPAATDDCLSAPKGAAPQGQHWYYRIERGTKRQCWYLREEGEKTSRGEATGTTVTEKPVAQKAEAPPQRSLQDAYAEVPMPRAPSNQDMTGSITPAAAAATAPPMARADATYSGISQPAVETRWPETAADNPTVGAPGAPAVPSPVAQEGQPSAPPPASTATLAAANLPVEKPTGSIPTLLLVVLGALGVAGLSGSIIYRFAGSRTPVRRGQRRRVNWEPVGDRSRAPWTGKAPSHTPRSQSSAPAIKSVPAPETVAARHPKPAPKADRAEVHDEPVDIDEITRLLEHLLEQGPTLDRPIAAAGSAGYAQNQRGRSDVRA